MMENYNINDYKLLDNGIYRLLVCRSVYEKNALINTLYLNNKLANFKIDSYDNDHVAVYVEFNEVKSDRQIRTFINNFYSQLADQQIRLDLDKRVGYVKELIYNKAFAALRSEK